MEKQMDSAFILKISVQLKTVNKKTKKKQVKKHLPFHPGKNKQKNLNWLFH